MPTTPRAPNLDDPGFTPGAAHLDALFDELRAASRENAARVERALARGGEAALLAVLARLSHGAPTERARLVSVLGRMGDARAGEALRKALGDGDERVARRAANALGKLEFEQENDAALRAAWRDAGTPLRRSLAEALGKVGGPEARALLEAPLAPDPELERIARQALLLLERRHSRGAVSRICTTAPLGMRLPVVAECRPGLAPLLAEELRVAGAAREVSPAAVERWFAGALAELFVARTALRFSVTLEQPQANEATLPDALASALSSDPARAAFDAWTQGAARFRLAFAEGGHQRALVFRSVAALRARRPELVNDPRGPSWDVTVARRTSSPHVLLTPVAFADPRFAYRQRDVRAASHPTIAAALARTAGAQPDDVVWDPFVGSGLELVERARLGPYRALIGSDLEPAALEAARENLAAAGVGAELLRGDAATLRPPHVSLILTKPPMGRRLVRDRTLGDLLDAFVGHAARVLVPGGRLVWLSPLAERSVRAATQAGFRIARGPRVDLGGFEVELQTFRRPA
jgi:23S rRNA G2445 N2-methylase RlmL